VVGEWVVKARIDSSGYSAHTLGAGLAIGAAQAEAFCKIRQQTRLVSDAMLTRNIRDAELLFGNAVDLL
jgi:hypothetical protein